MGKAKTQSYRFVVGYSGYRHPEVVWGALGLDGIVTLGTIKAARKALKQLPAKGATIYKLVEVKP